MSTDLDMTQYLDLFLQEAEEQLEVLEQETLKLETEPSTERLNAIFRAAHTLKGSSRAMGFLAFADLTHEMENVLDALRAGQLQVSTAIADALLRAFDSLRQMKEQIADGKSDRMEVSHLVSELQAFRDLDPETAAQAASLPALPSDVIEALRQAAEQQPVYRASFRLRADCVMKYVRAFMAVNIVQQDGEILATIPDVEALEDEAFEQDFELYFQSSRTLGAIQNDLNGIGEMESFDVRIFDAVEHLAPTPKSAAPQNSGASTAKAETAQSAVSNESKDAPKKESNQTVRVDVARLDELMNLVGELVIDRTRVSQIGAALAAKYDFDENIEALAEAVGHISRITSDLQDQLMKARMMPIETVFNRFPRMVRDLAQKIGKDIRLELVGGETELDRSVLEVIGDPLLHILRNSIDHGVESPDDREKVGKPRQGHVRVSARHQENHIVIDIEDDGRGIDSERVRKKAVANGLITAEQSERMTEKEALQLIFASGLSTAEQVSEVSGRGVGMDIVRSNLQKLGGLIDLETSLGKGTKFSLRLPLTLAIIRGLLVKVSGVVYVLPLGSVVETLRVAKEGIQYVNGREVIVLRGATTPLVRLRSVLGMGGTSEERDDVLYAVIVGLAERRVGLVVDTLIGEQEVVIKSLSRFCGDVRGISGATILGNGNVALILDVNGVVTMEGTR